MASIEKRGKYWRAKIRRTGFPSQSRSFDTKAQAEIWVRSVEGEMDRGIYVDRQRPDGGVAERLGRVTEAEFGAKDQMAHLNRLAGR